MSNVLVDKTKLDYLANAISNKSGEPLTLTLDEMVEAVDGIETSGGGITPTGNIDITSAGVTDVTNYATATAPQADVEGTVDNYFTTQNGQRKWHNEGYLQVNDDGWIDSNVSVIDTNYNAIASGTSVTPTESAQTIGGADVMMEGAVTVNAIPSNYVGSGITQRTSSDLSASGATVTAPSGYYASSASKSVASGSASAPSTISGTSASVSTGTNTLTLSKTVSVTPTVSAGYVSSGTTTNSSVSLTASVTTKGATTYTPTTSNQTIASGTYLTGTQTISGDANLVAGNIKSGTTIFGVTGTYTGGGGGTDRLVLLQTTSLGTLSTSSTSAADTGKTVSLAQATGWQNYDLLLVDISVDTVVNGRHTSTVTPVILTGTSNVSTKNTYTVGSNKWNSKASSSGTKSTRQSTTAYGVYINSASVSSNTLTLTVYDKYNSNSTGTLNGTYTARVYGIKLIDLIGG